MPEEEKKIETPAAAEEAAAGDAGDPEAKAGGEAEHDENKIDYEAELLKEREAREKAEKALADNAFHSRKAKREEPKGAAEEGADSGDEDRPLTARDLQAILAAERQQTQKVLAETRAREIAAKVSGSDAEAALTLEIHRNRTFPAHMSLEEQIEEANLIANKRRIMGEKAELVRALKSRDGVRRDASTSQPLPQASDEPKISTADMTAIKQSGFKWNGMTRRYEKALGNGGLIYRDPKTKQTVHVKQAK